jgi:hypothetical protein
MIKRCNFSSAPMAHRLAPRGLASCPGGNHPANLHLRATFDPIDILSDGWSVADE